MAITSQQERELLNAIQGLFDQLEVVTSNINSCPWTTKESVLRALAERKNKIESMTAQLKSHSDYSSVITRVKSQVR